MKLRPAVCVPLFLLVLTAPLVLGLAEARAFSFLAPTVGPDVLGAESLCTGDFNGDGNLDVATAGDSKVGIHLGNGDGTFATLRTIDWGNYLGGTRSGDFDRDGKTDLVVTNYWSDTVRVYWGNGDGTFPAYTDVTAPQGPWWTTVADIDRDGDLDIITGSYFSSGGVSVILGHGDRTFAPTVTYPMGALNNGIGVADLNLDGRLDLAVLCSGQQGVYIMLGDGSGGFTVQPKYDVNRNNHVPLRSTVGDYDLDGNPDVAIGQATDNTIEVLWGDGKGSFSSFTRPYVFHAIAGMTTTDIEGDGRPDIAMSVFDDWADDTDDGITVAAGTGSRSFGGPVDRIDGGEFPGEIVAGDFNNDGAIDLATVEGRYDGLVYVYLCELEAPGGWISIEKGAAATRERAVQVSSWVGFATEMRVRDEGGTWSDWRPKATSLGWTLPSGEGVKTVEAQYRNSLGTITRYASIRLDTVPPTAGDDAPAAWQTGPVTVDLTGADAAGSGIARIQHKLDGASSWTDETANPASVAVSGDGEHTLLYRAVDAAGNVGDTCSCTVRIDGAAPATTQNGADSAWHRSPVTVVFSAGDATSGVDRTEYSTDGVTWTTGNSLTVADEGITTVGYRSIDAAGNTETPAKTCTVKMDSTAPTTVCTAPTGWQAARSVAVTLAGDDGSGSGVARIQYRLDRAATWTEDTADPASVLVTGDGVHTLRYRSVDAAGNKGDIESTTIMIDSVAPHTAQFGGGDSWRRYPVTVVLTGDDQTSGVAGTEYSTDGGQSWTSGSALTVSREGTTTLMYRSTDEAGNVEANESCAVSIDTCRPTTRAGRVVARRMKAAAFRIKVIDPQPCSASGATVTIRIWTVSGRMVKALPAFVDVPTNALVALTWPRCRLPKGRYVYNVSATDAAGNTQQMCGKSTLRVTK